MSTIIYNDCGVTTILPMGVNCYSVNSTTPDSNDGRIYLTITGGSAPYSITWSNGLKDQNIKNLIPGEYTATVVDYYGDYSATTTCLIESDTFYMDYFQNCFTLGYIYLTGLTSSDYTPGLVYKFTNNLGCFTYSGQTLSTGQTITGDTLSSGPYDTCLECDPPPAPLPYYPTELCLYTDSTPFTAYPFTFYDFVNDRPAYTGTSSSNSGYTISWVSATTFSNWLVLGKTGNVLKNSSNTFNPLGGWVEEGTLKTWTAISGTCPSAPVLSFDLTTSNESCEGLCNGSVTIKANGGSGGYQYKLFNGTYQSSPTFNNLCPQNNTQFFVKDSNGTEVQGTFTILPGTKKVTYTLSLVTKSYWTKQDYGNQTIKKLDYELKVSPALPDGVTIDVPLFVSVKDSMLQPGSATTVYTPVLYSGTSTVSPTSNSLTSSQVTKANQYSYRYPYSTIQKNYSVQYPTVTLKKGLTVSGTVTSTITKINDGTSSCCQPIEIENIGTTVQYYTWVNCTGGTENSTTTGSGNNYSVNPGQKVNICACSVSTYPPYQISSLTINPGTLPCSSAVVDAYEFITVGFNGPSITNNCSALKVLTPQTDQLINTLYQQYYGVSQ
jgi:hypothetical protein